MQETNAGDQAPELRDRLKLLLDVLWDGNRAEMGRQIGVSHTAINKVITGQGPPGRKLLQAVAEHPKVNSTWLRTGEGTPLLAPREATPGLESSLPISRLLLPGPPADHAAYFIEERWPVPASQYRDTRYFLELKGEPPILQADGESFAKGDLLLFDADPAARSKIDTTNSGTICLVRVHSEPDGVQLARVRPCLGGDNQPVPGSYEVDTFDDGLNRTKLGIRVIIELDRGGEIQDIRSIPLLPQPGSSRTKRRRKTKLVPTRPTIAADDIVAVCIMSIRRDP